MALAKFMSAVLVCQWLPSGLVANPWVLVLAGQYTLLGTSGNAALNEKAPRTGVAGLVSNVAETELRLVTRASRVTILY